MNNRWFILAILFLVRIVMGFQFQSIASVSTFIIEDLRINYTLFGLLIGFAMFPGIVLAYPGGVLGKRFGDKRVVIAALAIMGIGGFWIGFSDSFAMALVGRILSGTGAVILSVLLTKMVADWFVGKEIVLSMAILVSSWPLGISIALITQPPLAVVHSWRLVMHVTAFTCLVGLVLIAAFYKSTSNVVYAQESKLSKSRITGGEITLSIIAGTIWMLFNVSFIIIPSFTPAFFTYIGHTIERAGALVSISTWVGIFAVIFGGYIAGKLKKPNTFIVASFLAIGIAMCLIPYFPYPVVLFIVIGLVFGPPAGIIMSLPTEVLSPENRAVGMGIFFTCHYTGMAGLQPIAGLMRDMRHIIRQLQYSSAPL